MLKGQVLKEIKVQLVLRALKGLLALKVQVHKETRDLKEHKEQ